MKLIIFDFDGTLADTEPLITQTMMKTLRTVGLPVCTREQCRAMIGLPLKETFMQLLPIDSATGDLCAKTYEQIFAVDNRPGAVGLFPHVRETLQALHQRGYLLSIATSRGRASLEAFLRDMQLMPYISHIVTVNDVERAKPYPDMVDTTLSHFRISPEDTQRYPGADGSLRRRPYHRRYSRYPQPCLSRIGATIYPTLPHSPTRWP